MLSGPISTLAALGSLFFSEVMEFAPCSLCWYQRIFMYPLVIVLSVGLFPVDRGAVRFGLSLAIGGWLAFGRFRRGDGDAEDKA